MPHTVKHDPGLGIAVVAFNGPITRDDLRESTAACISLQKRTGTNRFLVDTDSADLSASYFDLVALPEQQYVDEGLDPQSRVAVILPASAIAAEAARFYKTACANRGWNVQVFGDRDGAVEWLKRN